MRRGYILGSSFLTVAILTFPRPLPSSTTCVGQELLKPVHRICGVVFFPSGDRIHNANVSVLKGDKEIAIQKTDDNGKFSFDQLKPGNYELRIRVDNVPGIAATKVVLARPNGKSKKEIAVNIFLTAASCSNFSIVDAKRLEGGLNPSEVVPTKIQTTQEIKLPKDSFSMEFPFEHPVPLNDAAKKALASDRAIADVMKDDGLSVDTIPKNWFTAAEVRLGPPGQTDLVVMGTGISVGPYSTGFWVLRQTKGGYEAVLSTDAHDLALLHTSTHGFRDIETGLTAGGKRYKEIFKFNGRRYQTSH